MDEPRDVRESTEMVEKRTSRCEHERERERERDERTLGFLKLGNFMKKVIFNFA